MIDVRVQAGDFEPGRQVGRLGDLRRAAVAAFVGRAEAADEVAEILIDHHSALARAELARIAAEAEARWPLAGIVLIHRHGRVEPCGRVLFAGVAASDAEAAASACAWLVKAVRTRAPFWRKDRLADGGERWFRPGTAE
jgi:molybdopterin synthase catalytic subunit